jgi:hypothetical protein
MTPEQKALIEKQKQEAMQAAQMLKKKQAAEAELKKKTEFVVMPGLTLQKVKKKRAA